MSKRIWLLAIGLSSLIINKKNGEATNLASKKVGYSTDEKTGN